MKILFLTDNFPPEVNAPATRTYEHCKEWVKNGIDVTVITCVPNFPKGKVYDGYRNKLYQEETMEGIKVIRIWTFISANSGFLKRMLDFISFSISSFLAGLFIKTDIIIATSPQFFTALSGKALSFFKRKPWVMEVRDLWPESIKTVGMMQDNIFIKYLEWLEIRCYKSATLIVSVTDSFKEEIIKKGINSDKIGVIKNGVDSKKFFPESKRLNLIKKLNLENKKILGYIGTHGMAHKLDFILECAKELENSGFHFLFIGDGSEKIKLKNKILNDEISNVTMLESVPKDEVKKYISILDVAIINLRKSDLFKTVIPSKIFENAAMQIPILLGVQGESAALIQKYNAGLCFEPEDKSDFIIKLNKIFVNIEIYKKGGGKLAKNFDRKTLAKRFLDRINVTFENS